ncbi:MULTISPECIES: hypothetical protein [Chryseobacterium]|uniref:C1q domain-containing protein n=2 Tax=Chryseobacterium TaxID=59732 RepID=A0A543EJK7_9FLAO|nr:MULTISPECIES: hypothetical protein [Chryseobacterium]MDR6458219.1 hypothetical protein [Chryseobacterium vietnamense]TQM21771.1 hypothetical protein FB551_1465 [Chryseobacterium aquifrigidense]
MEKKLLPLAAILLGSIMFGQVGINTTAPKSTLDIIAKTPTGSTTNADGVLIPRVDRQRALSMISVEPSTLIYVNDVSTGSATGQASNIDAMGFYHFDGSTSKWIKLNTDTNTNIYNANGTLTGNRVMSMADNSLIFRNGNEASLYVERSGTGNLQNGQNVANLYTSGYVGDTNKILSGIRTYYQGDGTNSSSSMKLTVNGSSNNNVVLAADNNVGIGTDSPTQKLDIDGIAKSRKIILGPSGYNYAGGTLNVRNNNASEYIMGLASSDNIFRVNVLDNGNVGIGTTDPTQKLDVNGNLRLRDIVPSSNIQDITLVADANGVIKKKKNEIKGIARAYLYNNRETGNTTGVIYRLNYFTQVDDPGNDFDHQEGYFVAPETGLYKITMTTSIKLTDPDTYNVPNAVVGFADSTTSNWVLRFSIPTDYIKGTYAANNTVGSATTFIGVAELQAGRAYFFGANHGLTFIANPSGGTGNGIGSFFEIQLIKN